MDVSAFLATVIVVLFLVTIVMAVGSYAAYKLRERRRPAPVRASGGAYFERVDETELDADRWN